MASKHLSEVLGALRDAAGTLEKAAGDPAAFTAVATDASLLLLDLKATNRDVLEGIEHIRERTAAAKTGLDATRLALQNVLYEKSHIQQEITNCQEFRSAFSDDQVGLCDEAAFATRTKAATGDAGAGGATDAATGDAHGLMLARLAHELGERKQLCEQERALQARRALLHAGIDARRGFLDDLGAQLASVKRATLPLQHTLRLPLALQERRRSAARLLPPPLYTLYTQLAAAREAFAEEGDFGVDVVGSVADAESLVREAAAAEEELTRRSASDAVIIDAAPAGCEDGDEEDGGRAAKRAKRSRVSGSRGVASPSPSSAAPTYAAHPLAVELALSPAVTLTFRYLTALHIVTVEAHAPEASPVLDDDLLVNLFPGDAGDDTPNAANKLGQHGVVINLGTRTRASGTG
eukprot:CAMPEP_0181355144 /NCGR_PEP_ID=MMETSP1106-20121128/3740_1 /TAXON_ID=81844 /ORGANISM="Mantoniella antarctica, Strain SL-175" /LENGTH=407 /DNA_ID=CAMNT_0023467859 /DNA_START=89 /DNA_END=1308 /DNA_ORIENTATION=+